MSKGGRPSKNYRIERNGNSVRVFEDGVYKGSISIKALGEYLKERGR